MNAKDLEAAVAAIEAMALDDLRAEWQRRYGPPPPLRSEPIMRALLAWRIQAEALGGLDQDLQRSIARKGRPRAEGLHLGVGARLTRSWKGRTVEVVVEEGGFRFDGKIYRSLSAAATAIVGSKWNGPRFFGLRDTP